MTARQIIVPGAMPSRDANGRAMPGKLRFYAPGTTTPKTVYTASDLVTAHPFPILSDSAGRWPSIWADDAQSFDVGWSDQTFDKTIATYANVSPANDAVLASTALAQGSADAAAASAATAAANATQNNAVASAASAAAAATSATAAAGSATAAAGSATAASGSATTAAGSATAAATSAANAAAIVGFDPTVRTISAGGIATGGGTLAANRTITVTKSSQAQAQAGTDDTTAMTPVRVADAITALALPAQPGNTLKALTTNGTSPSWGASVTPDVVVQDQKTNGTAAASLTSGTWNDRALNTVVRNNGSVGSLASNILTLGAGTWELFGRAAIAATNTGHGAARLRIYNSTDSTVVGQGENITVGIDTTDTIIIGDTGEVGPFVVTIAASKGFKLQMYLNFNSGAGGVALSSGDVEVYATLIAKKVG